MSTPTHPGLSKPRKADQASRDYFGRINHASFGILRVLSRVTAFPYFRLSVEGLENLPQGPFVLAPNHASYLDPVLLQCVIPERLVYLMTSDWYYRPVLKAGFRYTHAIPVMEGGQSNRKALDDAVETLGEGVPVGIFPEGGVSRNGQVKRFRPGASSLAIRSRVPLVPVGIDGSGRAFPKGKIFPRPYRVTFRIGPAVTVPDESEHKGKSRHQIQKETTQRLRVAVLDLLPESYGREG